MGRPSSPILNRDLIRDTALRIIDADGLDAFSMRRLAKDLGVQAASLYGHFAKKEEVLDAIANLLASRVDTTGFVQGWQVGLLTWGRSYYRVLIAHPNVAPVVAAGAQNREDFLAMADAVHGGMLSNGWQPRQATMIAASVKYLVIGAATTPFSRGFGDDPSSYPDLYPNLVDVHLLRKHAEKIDSESFELALSSLIAGVAAAWGKKVDQIDAAPVSAVRVDG